jgi:hypothetical protein
MPPPDQPVEPMFLVPESGPRAVAVGDLDSALGVQPVFGSAGWD